MRVRVGVGVDLDLCGFKTINQDKQHKDQLSLSQRLDLITAITFNTIIDCLLPIFSPWAVA